jgi:hypothetical protein
VRVAVSAPATSVSNSLAEADIPGLVSDLTARPVKGPGFAPGRAAFIGLTGNLEAVTGNSSDCVRVDGSAGPCGGLDISFIDGETPSGAVDGSNNVFQLANTPDLASSLAVYRNGMLQKPDFDYTRNGRVVTFVQQSIPQPGDTLLATYRIQGGASSTVGPALQVLCSGTGQSTGSTSTASLASCIISANTLRYGDRVEIQFDYQHQGTNGFTFGVTWSGTTAVQRTAPAGETLVTGRVEAALSESGTQLSAQSWGGTLALAAGLSATTDSLSSPITVEFTGSLAGGSTDQLALRNYSVVRVPGR